MIIRKGYVLWHMLYEQLPKPTRFGLGAKIEHLFLDALEATYFGTFSKGEEKLMYVKRSGKNIDAIKFFLSIGLDINQFQQKKSIPIIEHLVISGKMIHGWIISIEAKLPPKREK